MFGRLATSFLLAVLPLGGGDEADENGGLPAVDPYTEQDPARIERAGYVAYKPFTLVRGQTTFQVDETVGQDLIWIETDHFRLGSSLGTYKLPGDKREKRRLQQELKRLGTKLEDVPSRPRELDPWLRAHLYAQRLEELYAEFCELLHVEGETLLLPGGEQGLSSPYLGQREKFIVLICEKQSTVGRYSDRYLRTNPKGMVRHFYPDGAFFVGTSTETLGDYDTDAALFVAVTFGVVGNLVDAFRTFEHETPLWLVDGLSHWFSRRVDERWCLYTAYVPRERDHYEWKVRMRKRVEQDYFPGTSEMFTWNPSEKINLGRQLTLWSRVDYLLAKHPEDFPAFLYTVKGPLGPGAEAAALVELQENALADTLRLVPADLDERWAKWVKKNYPKR